MANPLGPPPLFHTHLTWFKKCKNSSGLTRHCNSAHRSFTPESDDNGHTNTSTFIFHSILSGTFSSMILFYFHLIKTLKSYSLWCKWALPSTTHSSCSSSGACQTSSQFVGHIWVSIRVWFCKLSFHWSSKLKWQDQWSPWYVGGDCHGVQWRFPMEKQGGTLCNHWQNSAWCLTMEDLPVPLSRPTAAGYTSKMDDQIL